MPAACQTLRSSSTSVAINTTPDDSQTNVDASLNSSVVISTQTESATTKEASSSIEVKTSHAEIQSEPVVIVKETEKKSMEIQFNPADDTESVHTQTALEILNTSTSSQTDLLPRLNDSLKTQTGSQTPSPHLESAGVNTENQAIPSPHRTKSTAMRFSPLGEQDVFGVESSPIRHPSRGRSPSPLEYSSLNMGNGRVSPSRASVDDPRHFDYSHSDHRGNGSISPLGISNGGSSLTVSGLWPEDERKGDHQHSVDRLKPKHSPKNGEINIFEKKLLDLRSKLNIQTDSSMKSDPHRDRAKLRTIFNKYSPKS